KAGKGWGGVSLGSARPGAPPPNLPLPPRRDRQEQSSRLPPLLRIRGRGCVRHHRPPPPGFDPGGRMDPSQNPNVFHATTIVSVRRGDRVVVAGDGQVTLGNTVMKANARKVRRLGKDGQVLAGFAGAAADAFTLFELFESK